MTASMEWDLAVMDLELAVKRRIRAGGSFSIDELIALRVIEQCPEFGPVSVAEIARRIDAATRAAGRKF